MARGDIQKNQFISAALITGANRGLGLTIAEAYVDAGATLMLCARDEAKLEVAALALRAAL